MLKRHYAILSSLDDKNDWVSSKELAVLLDCSQSSIKNSVAKMNQQVNDAILSSKQGYKLNPHLRYEAFRIFDDTDEDLNNVTHRRRTVLSLLLNTAHKTNILDFCEEMYVSMTTMKNDIRIINKEIENYDLRIRQLAYDLELIGEESNKRRLFIDHVYEDSSSNIISKKTIQSLFPNLDIALINDIIIHHLDNNEIYGDEYAQLDILLHISLMIERIKSRQLLTRFEKIDIMNPVLFELTKDIVNALNSQLGINFSHHELEEIYLLLLAKTSSLKHERPNTENIHVFVSDKTLLVVDEIISFLSDFYQVDLYNESYYVPFALHIDNLLIRIEAGHFLKNPLIENLKNNHPFIYQLAVSITEIIMKKTKKSVPDDEIAYIALHLGGSFAKENKKYRKIIAALITPSAKSLPYQLKNKIEKELGDYIYIERIYSSLDHNDDISNYELILSTLSIQSPSNKVPVVMISPFFKLEDQHRIFRQIENIHLKKQHQRFINSMMSLTDPNYFMVNTVLNTKDEVIDVVSDILYNAKIVNEDFKNKLLHREQISSTAFHKIAIPHTLKMDAYISKMYIILGEKAIAWDKHNVNIVFLFAMNEKNKQDFYAIFEILSLIFMNPSNVIKSLQCKNYDEFVSFLMNTPVSTDSL